MQNRNINKKSSFVVSLIIGLVLIIIMVMAFYTLMSSLFVPPYMTEGVCILKYELGRCSSGPANCDSKQVIVFEPPVHKVRGLSGTITSGNWWGARCKEFSIVVFDLDDNPTTLQLETMAGVKTKGKFTDKTVGWVSGSVDQIEEVSLTKIEASCVKAGGLGVANWIDDFKVLVHYTCGRTMLVLFETEPFWNYNPNFVDNNLAGELIEYDVSCLLKDADMGLKNFDSTWILEGSPENIMRVGLRSGCLGPQDCSAYPIEISCYEPHDEYGCNADSYSIEKFELATITALEYDFKYTDTLNIRECVSNDPKNDYFNYFCLQVHAKIDGEGTGCYINGIDIYDVGL